MSITWNVHQPDYFSTLTSVAYNGSITESDATHVRFGSQNEYFEFEGSFTGSPASAGTVSGFRLYKDGALVLDASGYSMSFEALIDAMKTALDNRGPYIDLLFGGPMVVNGSPLADELLGGAFDDSLFGRGGDDFLLGRGGSDLLKGGPGNDGLYGGDGKDTLKGGGGDDRLGGGLGRDKLVGGPGDDSFAFGPEFARGDVDRIVKFKPGHDTIELYLDGIATNHQLEKGQFHRGQSAHDGDDLVIYNKKSGSLLIDFDGTGGAEQVKFAKVDPGLKLSHSDFDLMTLG